MAAEWGIGDIVKAWRILKTPLPSDDPVKRKMYILNCIKLHNLRCETMQFSQIRNVYGEDDEYNRDD